MTLIERYQQAKAKKQAAPMTPAAAFVQEIANVSKKSEIAVRRWLSGKIEPDALTQDVLAKHFGTTVEDLFPKA